MKVTELYGRCVEMAEAEPSRAAVRYLHETLVLACGEALRGSGQGFGNVFSQVDYLCKQHGIAMRDRRAIQLMRRHSNGQGALSHEEWLYDVQALSLFISAVFNADIPHELLTRLPAGRRVMEPAAVVNLRYLRCVVTGWDEGHIYATTADGPLSVDCDDSALTGLLRTGMQLNLLDCHADGMHIVPGLVVLEPDFLVDISAIAACFQDYGHHPFSYLMNRMKQRANSQQILLGNLAGEVLDDRIHRPDHPLNETLRSNFRQQLLQFCTCEGFNAALFKAEAAAQADHISEAVDVLFHDGYDASAALLEPSFVCERLGLQGRVDLMTADMRLLVEQKSGKNRHIELPGAYHQHREDHYVQLLLYYGVLRYNFQLPADRVDIRLLYSKYPAHQGLLVVSYYQQLFREAIALRNRIVALEMGIARDGFATVMPQLRASLLLEDHSHATFFDRYIRPEAEHVFLPLQQLSAAERDYVERMLTFVYREQLAQKVGVQEGQGGAVADLWNMPLAEKQETGNILTGRLRDASEAWVSLQTDDACLLPNFRRGDAVYVYRYEGVPDVRASILYKGVITSLTDEAVELRLNNGQRSEAAFPPGSYAIEHAGSDVVTTAAIRSIHAFCTATKRKRDLLLGGRRPERDATVRLSRSYHPHYDEVLLRQRQACDYFLLQGPPGTGKTSMALRFMVEEELNAGRAGAGERGATAPRPAVLLMAYTNRAVDEICGMLTSAGIDYLRLGSEASCDTRYTDHLMEHALAHRKLDDVRQQLVEAQVMVGTTSMFLSRPYVFQLKAFSLAIVDEASQILEPGIIGLLASERIGRFVLVGDHKQLPAVVQQPDDVSRLSACRMSLFERLLRQERQAGCADFVGLLRRQGRMHPDVARFPNEHFYATEQLQTVPCPHQTATALHYPEPPLDSLDALLMTHRVLFLPSEPCRSLAGSDKVNASEARIVADLLHRVFRQYGATRFDPHRTVGVIVPYRNQIAMIRHEVELLGIEALRAVSVDTVERYQGSQRDVIIYSFTIQQPYQLEFLTANSFREDGRVIDRKLNVAMTRAREQLLMTGCVEVLRQNPVFAEIIERYGQEVV